MHTRKNLLTVLTQHSVIYTTPWWLDAMVTEYIKHADILLISDGKKGGKFASHIIKILT